MPKETNVVLSHSFVVMLNLFQHLSPNNIFRNDDAILKIDKTPGNMLSEETSFLRSENYAGST